MDSSKDSINRPKHSTSKFWLPFSEESSCKRVFHFHFDRREALLCVLAGNCDEPSYVKLVEALCAEHSIDLIKVDDNKKLGEWAGLCKIDKEGKARKVVGCSCVVVKDWVEETAGLNFVKQYLVEKKKA